MRGREAVKTSSLFLSFPTILLLKALEVQGGRERISLILCHLLSSPGCQDKNECVSASQALLSVGADDTFSFCLCNHLASIMKHLTFSMPLAMAFTEFNEFPALKEQ